MVDTDRSNESTVNLFSRLRQTCEDDWQNFVEHPFVLGIQDGTLPHSAFRYYLIQDYLFLIQFARAYSLAAYKSENLEDLRTAFESARVITEVEMALHAQYCMAWGISEAEILATPESDENIAYTRYVLDRGMAGDLLDLNVALLPCMWGYAEIGKRLNLSTETKREGNPYFPWIEMYASKDYQEGAKAGLSRLDRLYLERAGDGRMKGLAQIFRQASRLESQFWQMGLNALSQ